MRGCSRGCCPYPDSEVCQISLKNNVANIFTHRSPKIFANICSLNTTHRYINHRFPMIARRTGQASTTVLACHPTGPSSSPQTNLSPLNKTSLWPRQIRIQDLRISRLDCQAIGKALSQFSCGVSVPEKLPQVTKAGRCPSFQASQANTLGWALEWPNFTDQAWQKYAISRIDSNRCQNRKVSNRIGSESILSEPPRPPHQPLKPRFPYNNNI
jgi:hypothetical protein